jgi:hypothetical protein
VIICHGAGEFKKGYRGPCEFLAGAGSAVWQTALSSPALSRVRLSGNKSANQRVNFPVMQHSTDPIKPWFDAAEQMGEYIGIRFGYAPPGSTEVEWTFLSHAEFDGIGGLAEILRRRGASIGKLPQVKHPSSPSPFALLRALPKYLKPRRRLAWSFASQPSPVAEGKVA